MPVVKISLDQLAAEMRKLASVTPEVIQKTLVHAARRAQAHMPSKTPTDMGQLRNSWRVIEDANGVRLENDAPHAAIVEMGARPHKVSREGIEALTGWAQRKLGLDPKAAESMAHAIAWRIRRHGQAPTYFVRKELETMADFVGQAALIELRKATRKPPAAPAGGAP